MTQDEIIRMAREAGLHKMIRHDWKVEAHTETLSPKLERFATLVAEAKDKEIAELAEKYQRVACAYLELSEKVKGTGIKTTKWGMK